MLFSVELLRLVSDIVIYGEGSSLSKHHYNNIIIATGQ